MTDALHVTAAEIVPAAPAAPTPRCAGFAPDEPSGAPATPVAAAAGAGAAPLAATAGGAAVDTREQRRLQRELALRALI